MTPAVTRGSAELAGAGRLNAGDAVRISAGEGCRLSAVDPAEVLIWQVHAAPLG